MVVVTLKHLHGAAAAFPDAAVEIAAWYAVVKQARWTSFVDVVQAIPDADAVEGYVIFNIRHNRYRLVTVVHYAKERGGQKTIGHVYVRSFLTHRQYDNKANWNKEYGR